MKKFFTLAIVLLIASFLSPVDAKKKAEALSYDIEGAGTATQGYYLVTVTIHTNDKKISDKELCKAAVHGVLFRGFSSAENRQHQKPLAGSPAAEAQHADFYKEFFGDNGTAADYANEITGTRSVIKSGKEYHVSATMQVNKELLVKYLSDAGMLKGLNSAF